MAMAGTSESLMRTAHEHLPSEHALAESARAVDRAREILEAAGLDRVDGGSGLVGLLDTSHHAWALGGEVALVVRDLNALAKRLEHDVNALTHEADTWRDSVPLLEPKMFSFNNPSGACPTCDGLGYQEFFDPARVVAHPNLSLAGGAVRGWDRRNAHYFQMIQSLARHFRFDIEAPWEELTKKVQGVLLYGSGDEEVEFRYPEAGGKLGKRIRALRVGGRHPVARFRRPARQRASDLSGPYDSNVYGGTPI